MQMQFTVQKKWPLDASKDSAGFKNVDGVTAYIEIPAYHMLSEGETFEADAQKMFSKGSGKPYYKLPAGWRPPSRNVGDGTNMPPTSPPSPPKATNQPSPPAANGYISEDLKQTLIIAQTLLKGFLGTGTFGLQDLPMLEEACVASAKRIRKAAQ